MRSEAAALLALLVVGCGDPLVGEDYLGTPAFEIHGAVQQARGGADVRGARLSLFWIGFDSQTQARQVVEQRVTVDHAFARFDLALFDDPPPEALTFDGAGIALIVVYADRNESGGLNSEVRTPEEGPDVILGAAATHVVAFASRALEPDGRAGRVLGAIDAGYHLFESSDSTCHFIEATQCIGQGALRRVDAAETDVLLDLHPTPETVVVPNPAVPGSSSGTSTEPGSLYGSP